MRWMGLVVALLLWVGCEQAVAAAPFEPIALHTVKLPADVARASEPDWIPGTDDLVFAYFPRGSEVEQVATARRDGSRSKCITCGIATGRGVQKPFAFDDGKRVLVRSNLEGAEVSQWTWSVAECAPSLARCRRRSLKPVQAVGTPATAGELQIR
ncbi:MAG TPA: hypothetical protein VNT55_17755, partial [Baekduia sp.]|nr:hypothetical protein [Baekduia sp.]